MIKHRANKEYIYLFIVLLFSIVIVSPIIFFGIPDTIDLPQHYKFAQTYYDSIIKGDVFPGWAGNENSGYGDIGIRFYPPLAYYLLAFARILVGNWYDASWVTFIFWMIVGSLGIFYWARCWFSIKEASLIAGIYIVIPFHLHQLYTGFNQFSEFAAASLLTFCFAFLTRIFKGGRLSDILGLGCFYALLIITHLPSTIVGSICLLMYFLTLIRKDHFLAPLFKSFLAVSIALGASAFYWVRLISEMNWLNHKSERFSSGHFSFANHFFPSAYSSDPNVFQSHFIVDLIVIFTLLFFVTAFGYFIYRRKSLINSGDAKSVFQTVLPVGLFAFFMYTPLSNPIWEIIAPLQKIQFPIRWMPVAAMCGAMICGAAVNFLIKENLIKKRICSYSAVIFSSAVLLFNFVYILHPTSYIPIERQKFEKTLAQLPDEQSFFCWWTVWSKPAALAIEEKVSIADRETSIIIWEREEKSFEIAEGNSSAARIAVFYYPHWKATINGRPVEIEKEPDGAIVIPVPPEKASIKVFFQEPSATLAAGYFSLFIWISLFTLALFLQAKTYFSNEDYSKI